MAPAKKSRTRMVPSSADLPEAQYSTNGTRRMPVKTARLDFTEDGYPDFHADRRLNLPIRINRRLNEVAAGADEGEFRALLLEVYPWWDFVDEEGGEIPHTVDGFDALPDDLLTAMLRRGQDAMREAVMPSPLEDTSSPDPSELVEASHSLKTS